MSAKKSFDIGHAKPVPVKKSPSKTSRKKVRKEREPQVKKKKGLRERREEARSQSLTFSLFVLAILCGALTYALWQPAVRITSVSAEGVESAEEVIALVTQELSGSVYMVLPRNSFFFYPEKEVRTKLLEAHPQFSSVSLIRDGFTALRVVVESRSVAFLWCGADTGASSTCYHSDANGFIYEQSADTGTTTPLFIVYGELDMASSTDGTPIRARVQGYTYVPQILSFRQSLESFGTPIPSATIRGDEVDLHTEGGTRITYVLGKETGALADARATFSSLNLMDGSLAYIDLRFPGKVYYKRNGE